MIRVFVYGSLMKNRNNHDRYLLGKKYMGQAILQGYALYELGNFPGIIREQGEKVLGELYEIDSQTLSKLDFLEDNGRLYTRVSTEVLLDDVMMKAEVYVWNGQVRKEDKIAFCSQPWNQGNNQEVHS